MQVLKNTTLYLLMIVDSFFFFGGVWIFQIVPDLGPMIKDVITLNIHNTKRSVSTYEF